ncbi:MAG: RluA family pseudouridine synthase [Candidatus Gastranaerophilales bacterium]|nr:RluA family pseudouridine synthase [Candidatus Gastranaerophilales bacterium]
MTKKYIFSVQSLSEPLRLDTFLSEIEIFSSRSQVQNLIKKNQVFVNGENKRASFLVKNDDEIEVFLSEELFLIIQGENIPLDVIYEDEDILVVNKPKKMLTHPTNKEVTGTLVNALLYRYGYEGLSDINGVMRPGIVHRLDRNTSGLLMVAKNNTAHEFLVKQIKEKTAKRQYLAIVHGNFEKNEGTINFPIGRNPLKPEKMAVIEGGKPSVTHYKVLELFKGFSYLELTLETGRTHQIRVHMSYISHPLVNDTLYNKIPFKVNTTEQVLQAYKLKFAALRNGDIIELEIQPDKDIEKVLKYLRSIAK